MTSSDRDDGVPTSAKRNEIDVRSNLAAKGPLEAQKNPQLAPGHALHRLPHFVKTLNFCSLLHVAANTEASLANYWCAKGFFITNRGRRVLSMNNNGEIAAYMR
jgi:hypothetical protein